MSTRNASSSKSQRSQSKRCRFVSLSTAAVLFVLLCNIPLRIAIAFYQAPIPQAILTLGGGEEREVFTAQFAKTHPNLEIWVSSGIPARQARKIFQAANIPEKQVHLDRRAADTVTNFTSLVADFKQRHFQHLYLVTSDFHMARAKAIAFIVGGSQGIVFTPVSIPSKEPPESWFHISRDLCRALVWLFTGRTGASLKSEI